jgi:hypothetical protein
MGMTRFSKPHMEIGSLDLQDDHYWRMADICFRHLAGAHDNYQKTLPHLWVRKVKNDDPKFGRPEYMASRSRLGVDESEEYTQSLAAVVFCHVWVISTANYYRLSVTQGKLTAEEMGGRDKITTVHSFDEIARKLDLPEGVIATAAEVRDARNTILHLVTSKSDSFPINEIGFSKAYEFVHCGWKIYIALLEYYGRVPDEGSWAIQTSRFNLPSGFSQLRT